MRIFIKIILLSLVILSCQKETDKYLVEHTDWENRKSDIIDFNDYIQGKTYLPVYSHIYHIHEHKTFDLTITISIRNVSMTDTVYILKADYFNTIGINVKRYLKTPIFLGPLETGEIVIEEYDKKGGSGANFIFDWAMVNDKNPPLFEAVMISPYEQHGLAFTTRGVRVFE
jgi:hypothetical protein